MGAGRYRPEQGDSVIIVGGEFRLDPEQRDAFLASRIDMMERSRSEPGCLEYTFAADPLDPGRVILFERWESQEVLDEHLNGVRSRPQPTAPAPQASSITLFDVSSERSL